MITRTEKSVYSTGVKHSRTLAVSRGGHGPQLHQSMKKKNHRMFFTMESNLSEPSGFLYKSPKIPHPVRVSHNWLELGFWTISETLHRWGNPLPMTPLCSKK